MAIQSIKRDYGITPSIVRILTTDDLAVTTAAGYITAQSANIFTANDGPFTWVVTDTALVSCSDGWVLASITSDFTSLTTIAKTGSGGSGTVNPGLINQLAYYAAAGTAVSGLATANNGVLITSAGGVPSISSTLPAAVQGNITTVGTITTGTWHGTAVDVTHGGTGDSGFTAYAVICGGTTGTAALQNVVGLGTSGKVLTSNGAGTLPTWQASAAGVTSTQVQQQAFNFGTDTGAANAYVVTLSPAVTVLTDGLIVGFSPAHTSNSTAATLQVSIATGPITINKPGNLFAISVGDIVAGQNAFCIYDAAYNQFQLINPWTGDGDSATISGVQTNQYISGTDTGSANAYASHMTPTPASLVDKMLFIFDPANANTGASTFDFGIFGTTPIVKAGGAALVANDLVVGVNAFLLYDSSVPNWQLLNPQAGSGPWSFGAGTGSGIGGDGTSTSPGSYALSFGTNNVADNYGYAFGLNNTAGGSGVLTVGDNNSGANWDWLGGVNNTATGAYCFIYGVGNNVSANHSVAIGTGFLFNQQGSMGLSDSQSNPINPSTTDQFVACFNNGFKFYGNTASTTTLICSLNTVASAVNSIAISNAATAAAPTILATGSDTNVGLMFETKGTGEFNFSCEDGSVNILAMAGPASGVNYIAINAQTTGNAPSIGAAGSDTNINLELAPQGTGLLQVDGTASFTANASTATVLGSVGPAGAHTTVQNWLTIVDNGGTTRYIPCF